MVKIKNLDDPFVRESLWIVYKKRCFYCGDPLLFKNMQIDHLIPNSFGKNKAIEEYTLDSDFELNSYNNLVPSCASCNNKKRAKVYEKTRMLFLLENIERKVSILEKYEMSLREKDSDAELFIGIKKTIKEDKVYELIKLLNENELTSLEHDTLIETLKKIRPISTLSPTENRKIQEFIDEINNILGDFSKIKSFFDRPTNRFIDNEAGIVIVNEFAGLVTYSLFAVSKNEKNIIREIDVNQWRSLASRGVFKYRMTDATNHILHLPIEAARTCIFKYLANLLSTNALYRSKNNLIATEFIIDFIDEYKYQLGLDFKQQYSINELIKSFQIHLPLWIDEALKKVDKTKINRLVQNRGYVNLGFIDFLISSYRQEIEKSVLNRIQKEKNSFKLSEYTAKLPIITDKLPFQIFTDFIFYFKNSQIEGIKRIYNPPDYERDEFKKSHLIYNAYSDEAIIQNLRFVYNNLNIIYNDVVNKIFPNMNDILVPFSECSKIIVEIEKKKEIFDRIAPFSYRKYCLEGEKAEEFEQIFYGHRTEIISPELRNSRKWEKENLNYKGKNYKISKISEGLLGFIYQKLPLFSNVQCLLIDNFIHLLEEDYKKVIIKISSGFK